jgi:hypothetical protein
MWAKSFFFFPARASNVVQPWRTHFVSDRDPHAFVSVQQVINEIARDFWCTLCFGSRHD